MELLLLAIALLVPGGSVLPLEELEGGMIRTLPAVPVPGHRLVTLEFTVGVVGGKALFDSERRGLPYTVSTAESELLALAARGIPPGSQWEVFIPGELARAKDGTGLLPSTGDLILRIRDVPVR